MKKSILGVLKWIILLMLAIVMLVPFFWLISSSLKDKTQFYSNPPVYFPIPMHFENFVNAWVNIGFFRAILNSLVFALTFTIIVVFSSALAAYGFSRFKFPGKKVLFVILLLSMMLPTQIMTIPLFLMFKKLNMINTILPMLLPYCLGVPYHIFLIRQFMNGIPKEVDEAAKIDGCGNILLYHWTYVKTNVDCVSAFEFYMGMERCMVFQYLSWKTRKANNFSKATFVNWR